ncbi:MAG: peptidase T [Treponemataceae bacterium]|nr:peptidase T [Treponemataceae bacterium]
MENMKKELLTRFTRYVKTWTTSNQENADNGIIPSEEREADFAKTLAQELKEIGLTDVHISDNSYVCGRLPASKGYEKAPAIGLLAHMDTVAEVSGKDVKPNVIENYDGKKLSIGNGIILDPEKDEELAEAKGQTIITTDGSTLLGADDKAGISAIMTAIAKIVSDESIKHGTIEIIFSPDEETGHGMDFVPTDWLTAKQCYTLDGGKEAELEVECFNAYKSEISFTGISMHTGTARPGMVNAISMAAAFLSMLPHNESPETTDGYQGFYAPMDISGHIENSKVTLYLRDFSTEGMQKRLDTVAALAKAVEYKFPGGKTQVAHTKQYLNMKEELDKNPAVVEKLIKATELAGAKPTFNPIRGGTDGSRLSEMGIPTPNVFTGGHNFHSRSEWASLDQMMTAVKTVIELVKLWAEDK